MACGRLKGVAGARLRAISSPCHLNSFRNTSVGSRVSTSPCGSCCAETCHCGRIPALSYPGRQCSDSGMHFLSHCFSSDCCEDVAGINPEAPDLSSSSAVAFACKSRYSANFLRPGLLPPFAERVYDQIDRDLTLNDHINSPSKIASWSDAIPNFSAGIGSNHFSGLRVRNFPRPPSALSHSRVSRPLCVRNLSAHVEKDEYNHVVDDINSKFAEAREEIELAMESKETVYFDEEAETARAAVSKVLERYDGLLARLPESEKGALQRSMGLKIEQLKAELSQLNE